MTSPATGRIASRWALVSRGISTPLSAADTSRMADGSAFELSDLIAIPVEAWLPLAPVIPVELAHTVTQWVLL